MDKGGIFLYWIIFIVNSFVDVVGVFSGFQGDDFFQRFLPVELLVFLGR